MGVVVSERRQLSHDRRSWQEILRYHLRTLFYCEFACFPKIGPRVDLDQISELIMLLARSLAVQL